MMRTTHDSRAPARAHGARRLQAIRHGIERWLRIGIHRLGLGKGAACARYERRHARLAGPRPGARLG
jgi:hypothetical protein